MLITLQLLYLDRVYCDCLDKTRTYPMISQWTSDQVKLREDYEKNVIGSFGKGPLKEIVHENAIQMTIQVLR